MLNLLKTIIKEKIFKNNATENSEAKL